MKLWFCLGTAAELIKIFPIIDEAQKKNIDWYLISTGQSGINLWKQYQDFQLPNHRIVKLNDSNQDLSNSKMALTWFVKSLFKSKKSIQEKIYNQSSQKVASEDYWFIHGDTLSTLLGSIYGRRLNAQVVHIEAGMRSHNIFNPFPEEIARRIVSRLSQFHMAPDEFALKNLNNEGISQNVFVTQGNTVMDTLAATLKTISPSNNIPDKPFALANIHRFENLSSELRWNKCIDTVIKASQKINVVFVIMPNTENKLKIDGQTFSKLKQNNIQIISRLPFSEFAHLMNRAQFVITDGGSNQEECFHLGKPCLLLRANTERFEGLGECCVLSEFKDEVINLFLENPIKYLRSPNVSKIRPTDLVFKYLNL